MHTIGHTVVLTTCDLTEHLAAGEMLRIKKRIFKLVSVKRRSIELDRRWLEGVRRALPYVSVFVKSYYWAPIISIRIRWMLWK